MEPRSNKSIHNKSDLMMVTGKHGVGWFCWKKISDNEIAYFFVLEKISDVEYGLKFTAFSSSRFFPLANVWHFPFAFLVVLGKVN